jgi:hypothetical protein
LRDVAAALRSRPMASRNSSQSHDTANKMQQKLFPLKKRVNLCFTRVIFGLRSRDTRGRPMSLLTEVISCAGPYASCQTQIAYMQSGACETWNYRMCTVRSAAVPSHLPPNPCMHIYRLI